MRLTDPAVIHLPAARRKARKRQLLRKTGLAAAILISVPARRIIQSC